MLHASCCKNRSGIKFTIFTIGTHGDVRPYVALGIGLQAKGHAVTLVTNPEDAHFCQNLGLNWKPLSGDLRKVDAVIQGMCDDLDSERKSSGAKKFHLLKKVMQALNDMLDQQFEEVLLWAQDADALIYNPSVFSACHVGQSLQKPTFQLQLQPEIRTTNHSSCFVQSKPLFGKLGNYASHLFFEQLVWQSIRKKINHWRTERLKLSKVHLLGPTYDSVLKELPKWVAVSSSFVPHPKDWTSPSQMTGFLYLDSASSYQPPPELQVFLEKNPAPLYIGLGSMEGLCPQRTINCILETIQQKALPTLISAGLPLAKKSLPDQCLLVYSCPHDWLFPQVSAVIHSGGIGTTAAGLKAGKPTLILPFATDQFFWGRRIFEMELGPKPLPLKGVEKNSLTFAINDLTTNLRYQQNATCISQKIREENGVEAVIKMLETEYNRLRIK